MRVGIDPASSCWTGFDVSDDVGKFTINSLHISSYGTPYIPIARRGGLWLLALPLGGAGTAGHRADTTRPDRTRAHAGPCKVSDAPIARHPRAPRRAHSARITNSVQLRAYPCAAGAATGPLDGRQMGEQAHACIDRLLLGVFRYRRRPGAAMRRLHGPT